MMFMPSVLMFIVLMFISSLISISSTSWFGAWMGLELNLLSFIPLITFGYLISPEISIKYFFVQALSSIMFLLGFISYWVMESMTVSVPQLSVVMMCSLIIKMGGAPFHMWFPAVSMGLSWGLNFLLMTWQKLAPFIMLGYLIQQDKMIIFIMILSVLVGGLGGLNQNSLRKLLAYSSINHLGWMISSMMFGMNYFLMYYSIYLLGSGLLLSVLNYLNWFYLSQFFYYSGSRLDQMLLFMIWLSFAGLPPFIGFMPKWVVLDCLLTNFMYMVSLFMIVMSLFSLFYYLRLCYTFFSQSSLMSNYIWENYFLSFNKMLLSVLFLMSLMLIPLVFNLM